MAAMYPGASQLKFPALQYCRVGLTSVQGVGNVDSNVIRVPGYDFTNEITALSVIEQQKEKEARAEKTKEEWLKGRADARKQKEINALKQMEREQKNRIEGERRNKEAAAQRVIQEALEAKQKAEQEKMNKLRGWNNAQLDLTGGLISPQQEQMVRNFQSLCGVTDDTKSLELLVYAKWNQNTAINAFYSSNDLDAAVNSLKPKQTAATSMTNIEITYPDGKKENKQFHVTDMLWALYTHVAETLHRPNFSIYDSNKNNCMTSPENQLNNTFAQIGMNNYGQVSVRPT